MLIFNSLLIGPEAAAIDVNDNFYAYEKGIFDGACSLSVNHAMTIVGYSVTDGAWILRNSWGAMWGESGHMRLKENFANANSCMIARYGYRPVFA
jgi:aminopeptidase C